MLRIGAHLTISKGLPAAAQLAGQIQANTFQYFTRNPRGGASRLIGQDEIARWDAARASYDVFPIVGHLPYTVNLAANVEKTQQFAKMVLVEDYQKAIDIGSEYLVVHPGSHQGDGVEAGIKRIIETLQYVFEHVTPGKTMLLLETMAGQGSEVGYEPWHLKEIIRGLGNPPHIGVCMDSCHMFAAGYDLRSRDGLDRLLELMDKEVGLDRVKAMHLNDSKVPLGAHKDRHEKLGQGYIGEEGIKNVINHPFIQTLALELETPVHDYVDYAGEIRKAREWIA